MDVSNLLTDAQSQGTGRLQEVSEGTHQIRQYITRQSGPSYTIQSNENGYSMGASYQEMDNFVPPESMSPTKTAEPKHVSFELLLPQSPQHRARLPMRVNIFPHDTTD